MRSYRSSLGCHGAPYLLALSTWAFVACSPSPPGRQQEARSPTRVKAGKSDAVGCTNACGGKSASGCWCDAACGAQGDCCSDKQQICDGAPLAPTCEGSCGGQSTSGCWCDTICDQYGDCCADRTEFCRQPTPPTDPCGTVVCESPPPSSCVDTTTLREHFTVGACNSGQCSYDSQDTECPFGCADQACLPDPCVGVVCDSPPADECSDLNTLRSFQHASTCYAGKCDYSYLDTPCAYGCSAGICLQPWNASLPTGLVDLTYQLSGGCQYKLCSPSYGCSPYCGLNCRGGSGSRNMTFRLQGTNPGGLQLSFNTGHGPAQPQSVWLTSTGTFSYSAAAADIYDFTAYGSLQGDTLSVTINDVHYRHDPYAGWFADDSRKCNLVGTAN